MLTVTNAAKHCLGFFRREVVLSAAILLALLSCLAVPPSLHYVSYIDWDTLALLFSLMAVMKGFQSAGLFVYLGDRLLKRAGTTRKMLFVLVFLPFLCSMVITNDVALITFIPFGFTVLRLAGQERLLVPLVVMQTVAANLGSMLTPMGNPQNLYLYNRSGMGFLEFCALLAPYAALSAAAIALLALLPKSEAMHAAVQPEGKGSGRRIALFAALGGVCLLCIAKLLPPLAAAGLTLAVLLIADRPLLKKVDYALLATFVAFFVFIGNMGRLPAFSAFLAGALAGREVEVAVAASQVISNVPAALLLAGYSENWPALIIGCDLGGLGTLIASMASLISYKFFARRYPAQKGRYLLWFTLANAGLLALLMVLYYAIR